MIIEERVVLDELQKVLEDNIKGRVKWIVPHTYSRVTIDEAGVAITVDAGSLGRLQFDVHKLHLQLRHAVAAEFTPFLKKGGSLPNISIVITR